MVKLCLILLVWSALLSVLLSGSAVNVPADDGELNPAFFLSSKTPYWNQQLGERESMPSHCRLIHVNHLGTRHRESPLDGERGGILLQIA